METRKVQEVGGGTFTVSIPQQWASEHGVEAGATVYLSTHLDGSLVVRRSEGERSELATVRADLEGAGVAVVQRVLAAGYAAGFKRIVLATEGSFADEHRRAAEAVARTRTGMTVAEAAESRIVARGALDASDVSVRQSVLQLRYATLSIHDAAVSAVRGEDCGIDHAAGRGADVTRTAGLIERHFSRSLTDLTELDRLGVDRPGLFRYYRTVRELGGAADRAAAVARAADGSRLPADRRGELASLGADTRAVIEDATGAVVDGSATRAHAALDARDRILERGDRIDRRLAESGVGARSSVRVLDNLVRIAEHGGSIAEVAVRSSLRSSRGR